MIWTLIVADAELVERAREWAAHGLVGRSLWIDPDDCSPEALATRNPRAVLLPDGTDVSPLGLMARRPSASDTARILWCRRDIVGPASDEAVAGMTALQGALPGHLSRIEYFDLIGPQPSPLADWPVRAPLWRTLITGPNDTAIPGGPSELHVDDATSPLLHLALVVGGVLATDPVEQPNWGADGAVRTDAVDVFSRVVTGRDELQRRVDAFLATRVPTASALDLRTRRHTSERATRLLDEAYQFLRWPGRREPVTYREPPTASFAARETVSADEHGGRVGAFVDFLFTKSRPVGMREWLTNELESLLGAEDLGYDLERVPDAEIAVTDYFELDRQLRSVLDAVWRWEVERGDAGLPDSRVWSDLVRFATGLVDGGPLPNEFEQRAPVGGRTVAVPLAAMQSGEPDDAETRGATGGIAHAPAAQQVTGAAAQRVIDRVVAPPLVGTSTRGSRVTDRLAARAEQLSDEIRREQADTFAAEATAASGLPFLDRLRAGVLGDLLASTLDASRLHRVAVGDLGQITALRASTFWFYLGGGLVVALAMVFGFLGFQEQILAWLHGLGVAASPASCWTGIAGLSGILVVGPVIWYFYHFQQYVERGRRQLEARCLLLGTALTAWREHARLVHADRILACWVRVLTGLYPACVSEGERPPETSGPPRLPQSLQIASPIYTEQEAARWLVRDATPEGWRFHALAGYASEHLRREGIEMPPNDPLTVFFQDDGLTGGPLATLAEQRSAVWQRWIVNHRDEVSATVAASVRQECGTVSRTVGERTATADFFGEIRSETYTPAAGYGHSPAAAAPHPRAVHELTGAAPEPHSDVLRSRSTIYWRTLVSPASTPPSDVGESAPGSAPPPA